MFVPLLDSEFETISFVLCVCLHSKPGVLEIAVSHG